jgi:hypothetical protein
LSANPAAVDVTLPSGADTGQDVETAAVASELPAEGTTGGESVAQLTPPAAIGENTASALNPADGEAPLVADLPVSGTGNAASNQNADEGGAETRSAGDPVVIDFHASYDKKDKVWVFYGTVDDDEDDPDELRFVFGGILKRTEGTLVVNLDGTFSYTVSLPPGASGWATVTVQDTDGNWSNTEAVEI